MPKHVLKLLALLTVFAVAPATASPRNSTAAPSSRHHSCPHERARAAIAWTAPARQAAPTKITLIDALPADGPFFGLGRGSGLLTP